jgi:hypothetical protein
MIWRLNYGNGQVNYHPSKAAALTELAGLTQYKAFAFVQRYAGDGEWVRA